MACAAAPPPLHPRRPGKCDQTPNMGVSSWRLNSVGSQHLLDTVLVEPGRHAMMSATRAHLFCSAMRPLAPSNRSGKV